MAALTHQQMTDIINKRIASNQPLTPATKSPLSSQPVISSGVVSTQKTATSGTTTRPIGKGNLLIDNYMYYGNYPESEVESARKSNNPIAQLYAGAYDNLIAKPQEQSQQFSQKYIDGRNIKDINPINAVAKVLGNMGAGALGAVSTIPAIAYSVSKTLENPKDHKDGIGYIKNEVIPNMVTSAQADPLAFGSQIAGGIALGAVTSKIPVTGIKAVKSVKSTAKTIKSNKVLSSGPNVPETVAKTSKTTNTKTTPIITSVSGIQDPVASTYSRKQIVNSLKTGTDTLHQVPGTSRKVLTAKEMALRSDIAQTARDATKQRIISISSETAAKNAQAPIVLNVAEIETVQQGIKDSQNAGFAVSVRPSTVNTRQVLSQNGSSLKSKPKDSSKRAGKSIVDNIAKPTKPTMRYSAGPNQREIILQYDPSQNVYMKLLENGDGRYDYIGDLTEKQISQLEKLDTNTGNMAKNREYAILSEPGYVRPDAGKFSINYKNQYGFNIEITKGKNNKFKYTLIDQIFHEGDNFPTKITGDIADKLIDSIENGRDIQLKSAGERWDDYKARRQGTVNAFSDLAQYTQHQLSNAYYGANPLAHTVTTVQPLSFESYLSPLQQGLRNQMKAEYAKKNAHILEGIESKEKTLPDGITNTKTYSGNRISINVKEIITPISKDTFLLTERPTPISRPKTNGRTTIIKTTRTEATPRVTSKAAPKNKTINAELNQPLTQSTAHVNVSSATLAATGTGISSVPLATITVTNQTATAIINGTVSMPVSIPTTNGIATVLDKATSTSTTISDAKSISSSKAIAKAADTAISTSTAVTDAIAEAIADTSTIANTRVNDIGLSVSIPASITAIRARQTTQSQNTNKSTKTRNTETKKKKTKTPKVRRIAVKQITKSKKRIRIRPNLNLKPDIRTKRNQTNKSHKYVQVDNYIPWLDEDEEEITKRWYLLDAKLMKTTKKLTTAIKKAIDTYNISALKYNGARKKLLKVIRSAGRTAAGKKAAIQLKKLYANVMRQKSNVTKAIKK